MPDAFISIDRDSTLECDYLVVGSGAGGALTASWLADKGKNAIVLEEGPRTPDEQHSFTQALAGMWRDGGVIPVFSQAKFAFAEGCCLGGSTAINSGFILDLPAEVLSRWTNEFSIAGLDPDIFKRYSRDIAGSLHARIIQDVGGPAGMLLKKGTRECGLKGADVPVAATTAGGRLKKMSMQETYLKNALQKTARILTNCRAERIVFRRGKATSLVAIHKDVDGKEYRITAHFNTLCLSAGAIQTPLLLRRSGITRNIGNRLQFHPMLRIIADFGIPLDTAAHYISPFKITEFEPEITMGASQSAPAFIAAGLALNWEQNRRSVDNINNMAVYYVMSRSHSLGRVRNIPLLRRSYRIHYPLHAREIRNLSFGYATLCRVLFSAGARQLFPSVLGIPPVTDKNNYGVYLKEDLPARKLSLTSVHAFGSCPMGERRDICAVDSYGRLHEFENVYINDASILPASPTVNPQGPVMAITLRNLEKNFR